VRNIRLIARLDIKGPNVIKGIHLEGLRVIGCPHEHAVRYYEAGVDELIYMDCVASLYGRNHLSDIISNAAKNVFVPITVGGGVRSVDDATSLLRAGADKIAINTAAIRRPELISELARRFGSQCVVLSVEAKNRGHLDWEAYFDNGRERSGLSVVQWIKKAVSLGAGEILLTSVDREGTRKGFDVDLIASLAKEVSVPLIVSGGYGKPEDLKIASQSGADAIAIADALHYRRCELPELRRIALDLGLNVRDFNVKKNHNN
jgi:cyclase